MDASDLQTMAEAILKADAILMDAKAKRVLISYMPSVLEVMVKGLSVKNSMRYLNWLATNYGPDLDRFAESGMLLPNYAYHFHKSTSFAEKTDKYAEKPSTPFKFLALPGEIRNKIYKLLLVADDALEYNTGGCKGDSGACDYDEPADCYCNELPEWCSCDNIDKITPDIPPQTQQLGLLRVCKQIHEEATSVYYGQPFRFDGMFGWIALCHWLRELSPSNYKYIRDISVVHPGTATACARYDLPGTTDRPGYHAWDRHLAAFGFSEVTHEALWAGDEALSWTYDNWGWEIAGSHVVPSSCHIIDLLTNLKHFRLGYPSLMYYVSDYDYNNYTTLDNLQRHPVHAYFCAREGLEISMTTAPRLSRPLRQELAELEAGLESQGWKIICASPPPPRNSARHQPTGLELRRWFSQVPVHCRQKRSTVVLRKQKGSLILTKSSRSNLIARMKAYLTVKPVFRLVEMEYWGERLEWEEEWP